MEILAQTPLTIADPHRENRAIAETLRALAVGGVEQAEGEMLALPQASSSVVHRFGPGVYIREVHIPAGTFAIGHRQRFEHMNIMLKGRVTILNDDGGTTTLVAPAIFTGKPGRKIGYIHEDMVWQNIYATNERDIETLEKTYLEKSEVWVDDQAERVRKLIGTGTEDTEDFERMLADLHVSRETVREMSEFEGDQTSFPHGSYKVMVADSKIEGRGLFATADIAPGEVIAPARIAGKRTPAGRYTNHGKHTNAIMVPRHDGDIDLIATKHIYGCRGGQVGEEIKIDYRLAVAAAGRA